MQLKAIVEQIQHETRVVQGEDTKARIYTSQHTYVSELAATEAFAQSVAKLLNVHGWSSLSSFSSDFLLYDPTGRPKPDELVNTGDFIRIELPGPTPENWVRVIQVIVTETLAEFTVQPSPEPRGSKPDQIEHFFAEQARSTFRVERSGGTISAFEIGQDEAINNQQPQAGERGLVNTVIAEAGWLFFQKIQWKLLTDYLVHL